MNAKRALVRAALRLAGLTAVATAVIGVAHTPWGRPLLKLPLLSAMASRAGCPVGSIEPADFERVRSTKLRAELGTVPAESHPALLFTLGRTSRAEVGRWVRASGSTCQPGAVSSVLECSEVQLDEQPRISKLRLQFDAQERLVSLDLFRSAATDEALVRRFVSLSRELDGSVGPATSSVGEPTPAFMRRAPLQTVTRQYRYRDYTAQATLLNLGKRGLRLREQYQWLAPTERRDPA